MTKGVIGSDPLKAVVLLSGGLDSYTAAAMARTQGFELFALTINYGQRHVHELSAARRVAGSLAVARHLEMNLDLRGSAIDLSEFNNYSKSSGNGVGPFLAAVHVQNTGTNAGGSAWVDGVDPVDAGGGTVQGVPSPASFVLGIAGVAALGLVAVRRRRQLAVQI